MRPPNYGNGHPVIYTAADRKMRPKSNGFVRLLQPQGRPRVGHDCRHDFSRATKKGQRISLALLFD